jgi:hypothetical protein
MTRRSPQSCARLSQSLPRRCATRCIQRRRDTDHQQDRWDTSGFATGGTCQTQSNHRVDPESRPYRCHRLTATCQAGCVVESSRRTRPIQKNLARALPEFVVCATVEERNRGGKEAGLERFLSGLLGQEANDTERNRTWRQSGFGRPRGLLCKGSGVGSSGGDALIDRYAVLGWFVLGRAGAC